MDTEELTVVPGAAHCVVTDESDTAGALARRSVVSTEAELADDLVRA
jgi:hypothetical protein